MMIIIQTVLCMIMVVSVTATSLATTADTGLMKNVDPSDKIMRLHENDISQLYGELTIRSLDSIPETEYLYYKKYVKNSTAYIIVHPAYYVFFHDNDKYKIFVKREDDFTNNIVNQFIEKYPDNNNSILKNLKKSLTRESMFLFEKSSNEELVVLVLPPDYRRHPEYPYRKLDEYGRYLNEVTKGSRSILYVESKDFKSGFLNSETINTLRRFFYLNGVTAVRVGGEYKDLCVSNIYDMLKNISWIRSVTIMPDVCTLSPDRMDK